MQILHELYAIVCERKKDAEPGSYTKYLFDEGLDKILKKVGEECAETIVAAKNGENPRTAEEICDLVYHLLVLMAEQGITPADLESILEKRREKMGNLKPAYSTDRLS